MFAAGAQIQFHQLVALAGEGFQHTAVSHIQPGEQVVGAVQIPGKLHRVGDQIRQLVAGAIHVGRIAHTVEGQDGQPVVLAIEGSQRIGGGEIQSGQLISAAIYDGQPVTVRKLQGRELVVATHQVHENTAAGYVQLCQPVIAAVQLPNCGVGDIHPGQGVILHVHLLQLFTARQIQLAAQTGSRRIEDPQIPHGDFILALAGWHFLPGDVLAGTPSQGILGVVVLVGGTPGGGIRGVVVLVELRTIFDAVGVGHFQKGVQFQVVLFAVAFGNRHFRRICHGTARCGGNIYAAKGQNQCQGQNAR